MYVGRSSALYHSLSNLHLQRASEVEVEVEVKEQVEEQK
jgi:hypothetical protein